MRRPRRSRNEGGCGKLGVGGRRRCCGIGIPRTWGRLLELFGHFEEGGEEFGGGFGFEVVGAGPGFVAAECEVAGGGHVAVVAVGEFDHEGFFDGAALFEFEAGFGEGFAGGGADEDVADAEGLDGEFGFGAGGGEALDASGVGEGEIGFALDAGGFGFGVFGPG